MDTTTITETGCFLDNHRGHYITRDAIELAIGYGFIIGPFEKFALELYGNDDIVATGGIDKVEYPHESLIELCDEAVNWLNSGQEACDNCDGGMSPRDGDYWTHKDDADQAKRCKKCSGTGQGPRISHQNFPPKVPEGFIWAFEDGDFGLYKYDDEGELID